MKRILLTVVLVLLLVGVAQAAYIPHWQNPHEVPEMGQSETSVVVVNPYEDETVVVSVNAVDGLESYVDVDPHEFTLEPGEHKKLELTTNSGDLTTGDSVDGLIHIEYHPSVADGTQVMAEHHIYMEIEIVESSGLMQTISAATPGVGVFLFSGVTIATLGLFSFHIYRNRDETVEVID